MKKMEKYESAKTFTVMRPVDSDLDGNEEGTMRIYQDRTDMNLVCLMSGGNASCEMRSLSTECMQTITSWRLAIR